MPMMRRLIIIGRGFRHCYHFGILKKDHQLNQVCKQGENEMYLVSGIEGYGRASSSSEPPGHKGFNLTKVGVE